MILLFTIDHQRIDTSNTRYVVTDSREYLRAKFIFTPDWDGCEKTAIFSGTEKAYEVLLTGDECTVPHEVLGGRFGVSVFGINGDMRITTDTAYITAHQSGFAEGETPSDPTPTVYEQLLGKINVVADTANAELAEHEAGFNHPDGCVTTEKIADYSITTVKIAQGAVNNNRIMNGAVNARTIENGAITAEKLSAELAAEIDGKAEQAGLTEEAEARADADAELEENKADKTALNDYYTKTETDELIDAATGEMPLDSYYTKTETDGLLSDKADISALTSEAQARAAADEALEQSKADKTAFGDYYTKAETDDLISDKADASVLNGYYTKDETDGLLNGKASASEIDTLEGAISAEAQARESAVAGLQSSKADVSALDSYYTKTETDGLLDDKADTSTVSSETAARIAADEALDESKADKTELDSYYTKTEADGLLNGKADTSALGGYYTKAQTDDMLDGKADTSALDSYYTKTETDGLLGAKASTSALSDETSARTAADTAINSTLTTHGNSISTLQSSVSAAEADIESLQEGIAAKADKPTITSVSGASPSVTLTDNTETQCGEVTALTLTLPSSTPNGYISSVIFTANSATPLTYPESIAMIGTDCLDGVFAPTAGVRYTVIVTYDGAGVVGYVAGYEVSA